jgi:hypothetical protein
MDQDHKDIDLKGIPKAIEECKEAGKSVFFFDMNGMAETFFRYSAKTVNCAQNQIKKAMGQATVDEVKEHYRVVNKFAMQTGSTCVFNFDKIVPDMKGEYFDETTTPECIFRPSEMAVEEVFKKTLREGEDKDTFGNEGRFEIRDGYTCCILSTADPSDADYAQQLQERMPMEDFQIYHIAPE